MSEVWRPTVLMDIVEEHFDELDFLWEHREANVFTSDWTVEDLAYHESRMEAHLDGLRIAAEDGRELARERIRADEPSAATAAALVLLDGRHQADVDLVLELFAEGDEPAVDGVRVALRHVAIDGLEHRLRELAAGEADLPAVAACDVLAFHRVARFAAARFLESEEPLERRLALGALGRTGQLLADQVEASLADPEASVRVTALREAARAGLPGLAGLCRAAAVRRTDPDPVCVRFLGVLGDPSDCAHLLDALRRPELAADAVLGLGAAGRVEHVPVLLDLMEDERLGPDAVTAYRRITGADDVEGHLPIPREPVAEGEDEREALPPDPGKARADWAGRRDAMAEDSAWQEGIRIDGSALPDGVDALTLGVRRDVFLRSRARAPRETPDLELERLADPPRTPRER